MKKDPWFYSVTGALFIVLMLIGFRAFWLHGAGNSGRVIEPTIFRLDAVHGTAIATWFVLFFVQALLIGTRNRRVHFTLGWGAIAVGLTIAFTGSWVAIRSVQVSPPDLHFFGMLYWRFLSMMLMEIALFTAFVTIGILARKKPKIHRAAMLTASLCLLSGATARIPFFYLIFPPTSWVGLFAPVFCIGAALLVIRSLLTRSFDRSFAVTYAALVVLFIASAELALTDAWSAMAASILKL
ncbi:MAG: hypothetical protein WA823_11355 [Candidatus Acidiferrales bacterium]